MMNIFLQTLHLEADHLAYWLDEALHNPIVSEDEFLCKVKRYTNVLRFTLHKNSASLTKTSSALMATAPPN